jgi:hypothetical protein
MLLKLTTVNLYVSSQNYMRNDKYFIMMMLTVQHINKTDVTTWTITYVHIILMTST